MKKSFFAIVVLMTIAVGAGFSQVNRSELESVTGPIEFSNYTGPHATVDTAAAIRGIGTAMSRGDGTYSGGRYRVIHAFDSSTQGKFDADIVILGEDAGVDHIRNLRLIIGSYLEGAYGYSRQDANTLAVFVTVYNAVYRGRMDVFTEKYKPAVTGYLNANDAGLSTSYRDWPGHTQVVIPFGEFRLIDTTEISGPEVVENLREEADKGIPVREDLVGIKEKEVAQAQARADDERKKADEAQQRLSEERTLLQEEQRDLRDAQREAAAAKNAGDPAAGALLNASNKQSVDTKEQLDAVHKAEDEAAAAEKTAAAAQAAADKKDEEVQRDKEGIAEDKGEIARQQAANPPAAPGVPVPVVYGLRVVDSGRALSSVVKLNDTNGALVGESEVRVVRGRYLFPEGRNFVAIAGEKRRNTEVKLVLIDRVSLAIVKESNEAIHENAVLVKEGAAYYTVAQVNGAWVIGRFNADLALQASSTLAVLPETAITVAEGKVIAANSAGRPILLDAQTLAAK